MISKDTIDRIYQVADIVEVIGDFVQLKKSGQNYKALSPFTSEKTPSFFVSPSKGIFKCFSTSKGGDAVKFIMEVEGVGFAEAIRFLGKKYGIEIEDDRRVETPEELSQKTERESLFIILDYAQRFFADILHNSEDGRAIGLSYFRERGFSDETIKAFGLGYSFDQWDALFKKAKEDQFSEELLEKAGLVIRKEDKDSYYDRFRGRVMFPIHNVSGKVVAFGARILVNDKKQPKYINSPETVVYHKSNVLYGISQAKQQIRLLDNCYLVEGYTDVISLHQAGIHNVVASSGTSLTTEQIRLIGRYTKNITVLYDGDAAGIKASLRGIDMILEEGLNVHAIVFPDGQDPDSYVRSVGGEEFKKYLEANRKDFITFKTELSIDEAKGDPVKKAGVIREIVETIALIPDAIKRTVFFQECSSLLQIDENILITEYNKIILKKRRDDNRKQNTDNLPSDSDQHDVIPVYDDLITEQEDRTISVLSLQEREIIRMLLNYGSMEVEENRTVCEYLIDEINDVEFQSEIYARMLAIYLEYYQQGIIPDMTLFVRHPDEQVAQEAVSLITDQYSVSDKWASFDIIITFEQDILPKAIFQAVLRLKWRKIKLMLREKITEMSNPQLKDSDVELLQKQYMKLKSTEMAISKLLGNVISG